MNNQNDQTDMPEELSYTKDDVSKSVKQKRYKDGWYAAMIETNTPKMSKNTGSFMLVQTIVPLKNANDASSKGPMVVFNNLTLPFANPKVKDHTPPKTLGICHSFLRSLGGEVAQNIPDFPKKEDGEFIYNGEGISESQLQECREEVAEFTMQYLQKLWKTPDLIENYSCYVQLVQEGDYTKVKRFRSELPEGENTVPEEEWFE